MNYSIWILIGTFIVVMPAQIYFLGRRMSEPEKMILPVGLSPQWQAEINRYSGWLAANELEHQATFKFGSILVVVFQQKNQPRYLSFMAHQRLTWCVESYMEDLTILDTTNSGSPDLFPRPGAYKQNFPGLSVHEIWRNHLEGEAQLSKKFGYVWAPIHRPYEEILAAAMRVRMNHNRSQFLWPFRVLYRYFVTGRRHMNQPISQQFPA